MQSAFWPDGWKITNTRRRPPPASRCGRRRPRAAVCTSPRVGEKDFPPFSRSIPLPIAKAIPRAPALRCRSGGTVNPDSAVFRRFPARMGRHPARRSRGSREKPPLGSVDRRRSHLSTAPPQMSALDPADRRTLTDWNRRPCGNQICFRSVHRSASDTLFLHKKDSLFRDRARTNRTLRRRWFRKGASGQHPVFPRMGGR